MRSAAGETGAGGFGTSQETCTPRFGDGYMITVRTKSSQSVKDVVQFFNRNFPEAMLKVGVGGRVWAWGR